MPDHIGDISSLITKKSPPPKRVPSRIEVLEGRVGTLESAVATLIEEVRALRASVERLEKKPLKENNATPKHKTEKPQPAAAPPPKAAKNKPKQPWDDPQRLSEIESLANRILASEIRALTKAETVERFDVDTKLAGQTLAWMVMKKMMQMQTPKPTQDNPDPKNVFRIKNG